ncbi:hypothetical protein IKG41_00200 [Candidatus Saccharibacteria bacterium]|nr:hypothetical protein [Candidatus Saccharibacteria bacterium]
MDESKKRKFWLIFGSAFAVVCIILVSIIFIIINSGKNATLDIIVSPLSAEIKIDGKEYKNGTYQFEPGEVEVEITKDGFTSERKTILLEPNKTTKLYTYLMPIDGSFDWYLNHEEDMMILNTIGDAEANADSASYREKYPIIEILPIQFVDYDENWELTEFRIDGGMFDGCEGTFCLKITDTTGGNYEKAIQMIKEKGFNPDDYEIIYENKPIVPLNN